jgi:cytochrome P450
MIKRRQILIAGMGTSPAVLTNAVWALAHQEK